MSTKPFVVMAQPLYNHITPVASGEVASFIGANVSAGFLQGYRYVANAYINDARDLLIEDVRKNFPPATHILFVDQDVVMPINALKLMLEGDKDVISGVYFEKCYPYTPVAWESIDPYKRLQDFDHEGVIQVAGVGAGCLLIKLDVLAKMEEHYKEQRWFALRNDDGEDVHFSKKLKDMSVPIYLDGRVKCDHVMDYRLSFKDRQIVQAQPK